MNHNAHVLLYRHLLYRWAESTGHWMAQLVYYTEYMKELDPAWKPDLN